MNECIFCKIVAGEIPSTRVYEDDKYIVFLDINPINPGHTLVIAREHYATFHETPDEVLAGLAAVAKKIAPAVAKAMGAAGYNIGVNTGRAAGQVVDHIHLHIIPRHEGDGHKSWHSREGYGEGEMGATAKKIKQALDR